MGRFVALSAKPADVEGFDGSNRDGHMPLVRNWPGLRSARVTHLEGDPLGGEVPYQLVFQAEVKDLDELLNSGALARVAEDAEGIMSGFGTDVVPLTEAVF